MVRNEEAILWYTGTSLMDLEITQRGKKGRILPVH